MSVLGFLRVILAAFGFSVIAFAVVLFTVVLAEAPVVEAPPWLAALLVIIAGGSIAAVVATRRGDPDVTDEAALVRWYQRRFLLGVALAEIPSVAGFVAALVAGSTGPYLAGLAVSLILFGVIAPTGRDVEAMQHRVTAGGSSLSLPEVLRRPMGPR